MPASPQQLCVMTQTRRYPDTYTIADNLPCFLLCAAPTAADKRVSYRSWPS
jgi:hypothetical protein